jgi:hypothetical protein
MQSPKAPPPDPRIAEMQQQQEERLRAQEMESKSEIASRQRARRYGGQRMLLSMVRGGTADRPKAKFGTEV